MYQILIQQYAAYYGMLHFKLVCRAYRPTFNAW